MASTSGWRWSSTAAPTAAGSTGHRAPPPPPPPSCPTGVSAPSAPSGEAGVGGVLIGLAILLAVVLVQAAVWFPLLRSWRRKSKRFVTAFEVQADLSGERIVRGPEPAVYRGGSGPYSRV